MVLLVVDEAHRSTGRYAYSTTVKQILEQNPFVRILALSATPGKDVAQVQKVINSLRIDSIQRRSPNDESLRKYQHDRIEERVSCELTPELARVRALLLGAISRQINILKQNHLTISIAADKLTAYQVQRQLQQLSAAGGGGGGGASPVVTGTLHMLRQLVQERQMLEDYGVAALCNGAGMRAEGDGPSESEEDGGLGLGLGPGKKTTKKGGGSSGFRSLEELLGKIATSEVDDPVALARSLRAAPHPKAAKLKEILLRSFARKAEAKVAGRSKAIVFSASRAAVESLVTFLSADTTTFADIGCEDAGCTQVGRLLKPHAFVGQADSKTSKGLKQSEQRRVIEDLKAGRFNILVATSIAEEGLDIGEVSSSVPSQRLTDYIQLTLSTNHIPHPIPTPTPTPRWTCACTTTWSPPPSARRSATGARGGSGPGRSSSCTSRRSWPR